MALTTEPAAAIRSAEVTALPLPVIGTQERVSPPWFTAAAILTGDLVALSLATFVAGSPLALAYLVVVLVCLASAGGYRNRMSLHALDQAPWLVTRSALALLATAPIALLIGGNLSALFVTAFVAAAAIVAGRIMVFASIRWARRAGRLHDRALIVGAGEVGAELGRVLRDSPEYGVSPVGYVDCVSGDLPYPVVGDVDQLDMLLAQLDVRRIIIAFGPSRASEFVGILRTAIQHGVEVDVVPRFFECGVTPEGPDTDEVRGIPLYRVRRAALRASGWHVKRVLDVVVAATVLLLAAPLFGAIALGVRLTSPGPVFFRQKRIGQYGQEIWVPKFRSLRVNHDSDTRWAVDADPRVTRLGAVLRRTSLDELPQLWCVLKGEMSLVGPRPERPHFVERFSAAVHGYGDRHRLPVGMTGWAQVNGLRGDTSIEERARYDNNYIEHWSLWRDIVILLRTVAEVFRGVRPR